MITSSVTKEQLLRWKQLFDEQAANLTFNKLSGIELDLYFRNKYKPVSFEDENFKKAVTLNAQAYDENFEEKNIKLYKIEDVYIGIGLDTGFFQVESENIEKCIPIYDDLFVKRGLNEKDMQNYVLVGQYLELLNGYVH